MGSQAPFRAVFDLESEEDRFFLSGAEKVSQARQVQGRQQRRRKLLVGLGIGVGSAGLVVLIIVLAYTLSRRDLAYACPRTYDASKADLVFFVVGAYDCEDMAFLRPWLERYRVAAYINGHDHDQQLIKAPDAPAHYVGSGAGSDTREGEFDDLDSEERSRDALFLSDAQLAARDPRWNATMGGVYTRTFPMRTNASASLDILFLDTNPIIYQYGSRAFASFLYGITAQDGDSVKAQLQQQLNASSASGSAWRLVVGHHPVRSYGKHCTQVGAYDCEDMAFLRPWLERYRVAAYINGHDHDQQLIKAPDDPVHYVVSGAGSDTREGEFDDLDSEERSRDALFLSDAQGFLAVVVTGGTMRLHYYTTQESGPTYTRDVKMPAW
ncbi:Purple acid phosphatase 8 [Tetrabaena socialis]|uniref:Purple acid phosphatase 8 n=1 Tax=Tetrabaena socialis TaxID=47790 RepID=A0A2J8AC55_9CHLO|nr:Purple acid phosphatase 8 [Tetrabaena socialis]|eukprot:PNH10100.1 Purple acid phosphatase 8 [Tetrabaena socialis]